MHAKGHVAQRLHEDPAEAEHDQRAEARVEHRSDDRLAAAGHHPLNQNALHLLGVDAALSEAIHHLVVAAPHLSTRLQPHDHATDIRLMGDLRRHHLEHHRESDSFSRFHSFIVISRRSRRHDRNAIRFQQ